MSHSHSLQSAFALITLLSQVSCHAIPRSTPAKYPHLVTTIPHLTNSKLKLDLRSLPLLHHITGRKAAAYPMEMPDSVPYPDSDPSPPSHSWIEAGTGLPVSYRIAIALDAFVLFVTIGALIMLGVYVSRQYRRRKFMALVNGREDGVEIQSVDGSPVARKGKRVDRQSWGSFGDDSGSEFGEWNSEGKEKGSSEKIAEVGGDNTRNGRRGTQKGHGRSSSFDPHMGGNGGASIIWEAAPIKFDLRVTEPRMGGHNGSLSPA